MANVATPVVISFQKFPTTHWNTRWNLALIDDTKYCSCEGACRVVVKWEIGRHVQELREVTYLWSMVCRLQLGECAEGHLHKFATHWHMWDTNIFECKKMLCMLCAGYCRWRPGGAVLFQCLCPFLPGLMLRPLPPEEPRVAVFVQDRDVTDSSAVLFSCHLFTRSSDIWASVT